MKPKEPIVSCQYGEGEKTVGQIIEDSFRFFVQNKLDASSGRDTYHVHRDL